MKIIATSDVHQMASKWKASAKLCQDVKPDIFLVAGDIFPKNDGIRPQVLWINKLKKYAQQIKDAGVKLVLMLGNDDNQLLIPDMIQGDKDGLWYYVADKVIHIDGYDFVGMPWVPDYPFGYKYWCKGEFDNKLRIDPKQICKPLLIDDNNKFVKIKGYKQYLTDKGSIDAALNSLASQVKDMNKSIWLIHAPPSSYDLDVCAGGDRVGSNAVLKFIIDHQPLLTIHGHIHESPIYSDVWKAQIGNTLAIQGGQVDFTLNYTTIYLKDGQIKSAKHSKYD